MFLEGWLEKASRVHKYIRRTPKKSGKGYDYTYADQPELPLKPRATKPEPTKLPVETAPPKIEPPKVTPKETQQGKEALNVKEDNAKVFGLASDVVRAAIPKSDRDATLKAARAMLEIAKQPGQKGKVLKEIRALAAEARKHAKTMNNRYNADRYKEKPPKGRELYTYDDVLKARSVRDLLDKAREKVQGIKAGKKVEKPTQEVEANLKPPPEAKKEAKQEKREYHKEPNFREFGRQKFSFDIPGTRMTAAVDQDPDIKSMSRYEALKMTVKDASGEVQGTLKAGYDHDVGEFITENARIEGDIPAEAKPLLLKLMGEGLNKRIEINRKKVAESLRPKPKATEGAGGVESGGESPKGEGPSFQLQSRPGQSATVSLGDPMYSSEKALMEATQGWWQDDHKEAAKLHRQQAKDLGGSEGKKHRHLANAHMSMANWIRDRAKYPGTAAASAPFGVGSHLDLAERVKKSMPRDVDSWLSQADDELEKSYDAIKTAYAKKYGADAWDKIDVPKDVEESEAKPEKLPFGSKTKLSPVEKHKYTEAKRRLAGSLGMPKEGWGLYGRSIVGALKQKEKGKDTDEKAEKAMGNGDNKPGESLQETSTEELTQTKKDLEARLKSRMDPDQAKVLKARHAAISGELERRGGKDSMDKCGPGMQKACGKKHGGKDLKGWMDKAENEGEEPEDNEENEGKTNGEEMEKGGSGMTLDEWMAKAMPTHEARMGGPKSDVQGASQDGGDWEGKGKTPDNNGGPVNAAGTDAQGKATGSDPGKQDKLSEDDEEQGEIGAPEKKKPIEKLGKSELYPAPLTPGRQREMMAHDVAKLRKSQEMVTIGPDNHPYGYRQTMGADHDAMSKSEGNTDIPRLSVSPGQSLAQSHVLCKSVHPGGCDAHHSAMLTACPECGAGVTQHRIWPNSSEVRVIPQAGPGGLRPAKRDRMIKIH